MEKIENKISSKSCCEEVLAIDNLNDINEASKAAITMSYVTFREDLMDDNGT